MGATTRAPHPANHNDPSGQHELAARVALRVAAARLRAGLRQQAAALAGAWLAGDVPSAPGAAASPAASSGPSAPPSAPPRVARLVASARLRLGLRRHAGAADTVPASASLAAAAPAPAPAAAWASTGASPSPLAVLTEQAGFGLKERAWNDRALLGVWRARWAEMANARLAELGHDARIDHRSNAARGLALEPQNKVGPAAARRARQGDDAGRSERVDEHRAIARRNGEQLLARPELALEALGQRQSTWTRHDLVRLLHRHTDGAEQFAAVLAQVEASPELVRVGDDGRGRARFSTRELVAVERDLVAAALSLTRRTTHRVADGLRAGALAGTGAGETGLGEEQRLAYLHVTRSRDLAVVAGIAGGGKSTMLGAARRAWEGAGYRVQGAALAGIAAEALEGSAGIPSRTLAGWEHAWDAGRERLTARDVLVLDEAGMVGSRQLGRLLRRVGEAGAKLVLVGDAEQLQAIEAGAAFRAVAERVGAIAITEPRRQAQDWQRLATRELATARTDAALDRYEGAGMLHRHAAREAALAGVVGGWDASRRAHPGQSQVIFAHERADVRLLNEAARAVRRAAGELGPDQEVQTELGMRFLAVGDQVYFLRNERGLGVKNGTLGTLERIEGGGNGLRLTVRLDGPEGSGAGRAGTGRAVSFALSEYAHLDHGYAATVHKNQGTTVDRAHVLATPGMDRHLAYVALSRHRQAVELHWAEEDFASPARLRAALGRERAKDTTLDYGGDPGGADLGQDPVVAYAGRRGLDPLRPESAIVVPPEMVQVPGQEPVPAQLGPATAAPAAAGGDETDEWEWDALPSGPARTPTEAEKWAIQRILSGEDLGAAPAGDAAPAADEWGWDATLDGLARMPTEAERRAILRILNSEDADVAPATLATMAAPTAAESLAMPPGAHPTLAPSAPPAPMLPAVPCQPVTAEEVAAAVSADKAVRDARAILAYALERAYRDPDGAARRLAVLEAEPGGAKAIAAELARKPGTLGRLRGSGLVFAVDGAVERHFALEAAGKVGEHLAAQRQAEREAERAYRLPVEERRRGEAVEVPGLSPQAWRVVEALQDRGTPPRWTWLQPWDEPRPPTERECSIALRVAPVWAAVVADPRLRDELAGFVAAAGGRLDGRLGRRDGLTGPEEEVDALRGLLAAAEALHEMNPMFERYAAGEDRRQAVAARLAAEQEAAAGREAAAAGPRRELEAMRGRLLADGIEAWWRRKRPWVAPHRRGEAPDEVRDGLRRDLAALLPAELQERDAKLARRGPLREWEPPRAGSAGPSPGM